MDLLLYFICCNFYIALFSARDLDIVIQTASHFQQGSMSENIPPPTYSQQDPVNAGGHQRNLSEPEILITPTVDAVNFQKGFLGAEGERAAIEGELQIKGVDVERWLRM